MKTKCRKTATIDLTSELCKQQSVLIAELAEALKQLVGMIRDMANVYDNYAAEWLMKKHSFAKAEAALKKAGLL